MMVYKQINPIIAIQYIKETLFLCLQLYWCICLKLLLIGDKSLGLIVRFFCSESQNDHGKLLVYFLFQLLKYFNLNLFSNF